MEFNEFVEKYEEDLLLIEGLKSRLDTLEKHLEMVVEIMDKKYSEEEEDDEDFDLSIEPSEEVVVDDVSEETDGEITDGEPIEPVIEYETPTQQFDNEEVVEEQVDEEVEIDEDEDDEDDEETKLPEEPKEPVFEKINKMYKFTEVNDNPVGFKEQSKKFKSFFA
jgi:hypothetical protein